MAIRPIAVSSLMLLGLAVPAVAEEPSAFVDLCDEAWDSLTLYKDKNNPYMQKFSLVGRFQGDYIHIEGEGVVPGTPGKQDLHDDDYNTRRLRLGAKATVFNDFTMHVEADFKPDESPIYNRLTDAYIGWKHSDQLSIKVGKQSMGFTLEGSTSSKKLLTIDRSNVANNLWFSYEYAPGISASGSYDNWHYKAGIFSQGEEDDLFGRFDQGAVFLASAGYDFSDNFNADQALLTLDYVYNQEPDAGVDLFTNRNLNQIAALHFQYAKDDYGVRSELAYGDGFLGQPDVWGFSILPFYDFTECLQGVLRYTYVESDGDNGVRLTGYESATVIKAKGDRYHEIYGGLNYYIYGHKLKVQTGLAYLSMDDAANDGGEFDGFSWVTGFRLSW